ncbi:hypothetical protein [Mycobacterium sp. SM3041]|uniref:hypothetical protein n=1 Tax=Mycobacterium sp. SM3041 TaxID=3114291 RepID=UPI003204783D
MPKQELEMRAISAGPRMTCPNLSAELTDITAELVDGTGLIDSPAHRPGTPQRAALDARIAGLAARQEALSAEAVKPSGWVWSGTGEQFLAWWDRQDVTARNTGLRSTGVQLSWNCKDREIELGEVFQMADELKAVGGLANLNASLTTMKDNGIQRIEFDRNLEVIRAIGVGQQPTTAENPGFILPNS